MILELGYDGTTSHFDGVQGGVGIYSNQINPKYLALGNLLNQPETPTTLAQAQAQFPEITVPFATFAGSIGQMLRPFPQYSAAGGSFEGPDPWASFGTSGYNSFQARLSRRMTNGLYFLASYTKSKLFDDGGDAVQFFNQTLRSAYNLRAERSVSSYDRAEVLSFSEVYTLPFGKGQLLGGGNAVADAIIGGWQLSGIEQYSSGTPIGTIFGALQRSLLGRRYSSHCVSVLLCRLQHGIFRERSRRKDRQRHSWRDVVFQSRCVPKCAALHVWEHAPQSRFFFAPESMGKQREPVVSQDLPDQRGY